jgi:hypothetical protein
MRRLEVSLINQILIGVLLLVSLTALLLTVRVCLSKNKSDES